MLSSEDSSEEARAFLQRRVAWFGKLCGIILLFGVVFRVAFGLALGLPEHSIAHASLHKHAIAGLDFIAIYLVFRRGSYSLRTIRMVETLGLLIGTAMATMMAFHVPIHIKPEHLTVISLAALVFVRAVFVPSRPLYTTVVTAAVGIPLLGVTYWNYATRLDLSPGSIGALEWSAFEGVSPALLMTSVTAFNWAIIVLVCAATAKLLYGLRRQMRDARRLGQYTLERKLGAGGMGVVYEASHAMLRRPSALKLLPQDRAGARSIARFEREVQMTARLSHPNTVTIFDYGRTPEGVFYYVMELVDGATLQDLVEIDGPQPPERIVHILQQASGALAEAHGVGLIHRDIKPSNIMLSRRGGVPDWVKVLDFGLVKEIDAEAGLSLSRADVITGTPQYMAPESIVDPTSVDARGDIYALGCVAYYLLTAEHLFDGATPMEVCIKHVSTAPTRPSERLGKPVDPGLEGLIMRCLDKDPLRRPASAVELQAAVAGLGLEGWDGTWWWDEFGPILDAQLQHRAETVSDDTVAVDISGRSPALEAAAA